LIGLVVICKNEENFIGRCLRSVKPLLSWWTIVDTGSTDHTKEIIRKEMKGVKGELHESEFVDFSTSRNEALAHARGKAKWLLLLDADETVEAHEDLLTWLEPDPCPEVDAWQVAIHDSGTTWRRPLLIRGDREWRYIGPVHEYLDTSSARTRPLLGLDVTHHGSNRHNAIVKFDRYLTLLKPDLERGDPRATFYSAECYRFLGCIPKAIELYQKRASMNSFEEEAWYAEYQAAKLSRNVTALLKAYERRPWRPEPLWAAADIARTMPHNDLLFLEAR
jgi:glycosyltransferase involved in cell wall biosynthesis